jgi:hypothetical protein
MAFSYFFCLMIEGSGSGSVPLTNGSGSGRPENLRIRIRNTDLPTLQRIRLRRRVTCGDTSRAFTRKCATAVTNAPTRYRIYHRDETNHFYRLCVSVLHLESDGIMLRGLDPDPQLLVKVQMRVLPRFD